MSDIKKPGECCPECESDVLKAIGDLLDEAKHNPNTALVVAGFNHPNRPRVHIAKAIDWSAEITHDGRQGDVVWCEVTVPHRFRILKKIATSPPDGVLVRAFAINGKRQLPPVQLFTEQFTDSPLGCGMMFDTVLPGSTIAVELAFLVTGRFDAAFLGKAVKE